MKTSEDNSKKKLLVLVILLVLLYLAWRFLTRAMSMAVSFLDRQTALYVGLGLLVLGLNLLRMQARLPKEKRFVKITLAVTAAGGLLVAYGMEYI